MTNALPLLPAGHFEHLPADPCLAILAATEQALAPDPEAFLGHAAALDLVAPINRPLVPRLAALLQAARAVAEAAAENAVRHSEPVPAALTAFLSSDLHRITSALKTASLWARSEALPAVTPLPPGHRLPTNLDTTTLI